MGSRNHLFIRPARLIGQPSAKCIIIVHDQDFHFVSWGRHGVSACCREASRLNNFSQTIHLRIPCSTLKTLATRSMGEFTVGFEQFKRKHLLQQSLQDSYFNPNHW